MRNPLILPVYVPTFLLAFGRGMLVPILPLYASSFDISYGLIGLVLASQGLGNLIGDLPAGVLQGRLGQRYSMLIGIAIVAIATLAMAWARTVPELVAYGLISGLGMAMFNISRHAYITTATPLFRRGRAIAIFGGINRIGAFVGPALGGLIGELFGLRMPFVVFAGVATVAFILPAIFAVETEQPTSVARGGVAGHSRHLMEILRAHHRVLTSAGIGQFFAQMIRSGRQIIVPLYASDVLGLEVGAIGTIISLSALIDMSMFYPAGMIMDRFGRKYAYVPSFLIQSLGMALIPFTGGYFALLGATLIIGFGNGIGSGTMMTLGADLAPRESMGEFLGIWRLIGDAGTTGAPIAVGAVADLVGLSAAAFVMAGAGLAAAVVLGVFVPETLIRQPVVSESPVG